MKKKDLLISYKKDSIKQNKYLIDDMYKIGMKYIKEFEEGTSKEQVPTLSGWLARIGCGQDVLARKLRRSDRLEGIAERISAFRENKLIQKSLDKTFNSTFAMFLLKCKHGYIDTPQTLVQNNFNMTNDVLKDVMDFQKPEWLNVKLPGKKKDKSKKKKTGYGYRK